MVEPKITEAESIFWRGKANYALGDYDTAIANFSEVARISPNYTLIFYWLGMARYHKNDFDGALVAFTTCISRDSYCAPAYYWRGIVKKERGDFKGAVDDLQKVTALQAETAAHKSMKDAPLPTGQPGDYDEMLRDMKQVLYETPEVRKEVIKKREEVIKPVRRSEGKVALEDTQSISFYWLGWEKEGRGDMQGALNDFNKVIQIRPSDARAYLARGKLHIKMGNFLEALRDLMKATEIKPELKDTLLPLIAKAREKLIG